MRAFCGSVSRIYRIIMRPNGESAIPEPFHSVTWMYCLSLYKSDNGVQFRSRGRQRREHSIWQWTQSHWLCQPEAIMAIPSNATLAPSQSVLIKSTPSTTLSQTRAVAT